MDKSLFTGFVKGVSFQESGDEHTCQVILGNDYNNYILSINYKNAKNNITEEYNLSINEIEKDDLTRLIGNNCYLPNTLIVEQVDLSTFANNKKPEHFSINGIIAINQGNVMFFEQCLMPSDFLQLQNSFELSSDDFELKIATLHELNYGFMDISMDESKDSIDKTMDAFETLKSIESDTRKPLFEQMPKQINPIEFYKGER